MSARVDNRDVAAVDLGSNSFHMIVAREDDTALRVVDRIKTMVRIGEGLDARGRLDPRVATRALDALGQFGQRLAGFRSDRVRAVGTNTLREMADSDAFLERAREALGYPVEIVSGQEEARLIYQGVARSLADDGRARLVVDIGGGSTEMILGTGLVPTAMDSLEMGCVTLTRRCLADGRLTPRRLERAATEVGRMLEPVAWRYGRDAWQEAVGASGTVRAVAGVLEALGSGSGTIDAAGLDDLHDRLLAAGHRDALALPGLDEGRRPVFPAGVVILRGLFRRLGIETMAVSDGALREGLLHDLVGRRAARDIRDDTVDGLMRRYQVDRTHAQRVRGTALTLLDRVHEPWSLPSPAGKWLGWAAALHEMGLDIAHRGYHRHGAYVARNGDLVGFSSEDQRVLAALIRCHRKKISRQARADIPEPRRATVERLIPLLRLAVLLHRSRVDEPAPLVAVEAEGATLRLTFPPGWIDAHPLTRADLVEEKRALRRVGVALDLAEAAEAAQA